MSIQGESQTQSKVAKYFNDVNIRKQSFGAFYDLCFLVITGLSILKLCEYFD